jgi:hypothetical protein
VTQVDQASDYSYSSTFVSPIAGWLFTARLEHRANGGGDS